MSHFIEISFIPHLQSAGIDSFLIQISGGNRSQILRLGAYLDSRDPADLGDWVRFKDMPRVMEDAAITFLEDDDSMILIGGRVNRVSI